MEELGTDILLVQEPYTYSGRVKGYGISARIIQGESRNCKAAIVVRNKEYVIMKIASLCGECWTCIEVDTGHERWYMVSLYCQHGDNMEPYLEYLARVVTLVGSERLFIGMDANAKSPMWHSTVRDQRGEALEEWIGQHGMVVLNKENNPPTFSTVNGESRIDVTLSGPRVSTQIEKWKVRPDWSTSDHRCIEIQIKNNRVQGRGNIKLNRFNVKTANWDKFRDTLYNNIETRKEEIAESDNINGKVNILNEIVHTASVASMRHAYKRQNSVPWWSQDLTTARTETAQARKRMQRLRDGNGHIAWENAKAIYRITRNRYTALIRKEKKESWQKLVGEKGNQDPWGIVYKIMHNKIIMDECFCSMNIPGIGNVPGVENVTWEESVKMVLDKLMPEDNRQEEERVQQLIRNDNENYRNENIIEPFSHREIHNAIMSAKIGKSPGPDNMEVETMKRLWEMAPNALIDIYNDCLKAGMYPTGWKEARVRILLKHVDKAEDDPGSYRPIALLPVLGKTFERMIIARISQVYESMELSSSAQFGFKKGCSTEDALVQMMQEVTIQANTNKYIMGIFFDIKGAFDNLWWESVLRRLRKANCPQLLYNLMRSYFTERTVTVTTSTGKVQKEVTKGCPQGSVMGPFAWNIVFDELLTLVLENLGENGTAYAYADDLLVLVWGNSRAALERISKRCVDLVEEWCNVHKMRISEPKTHIMMLKGEFEQYNEPKVYVYDKKIKIVRSIKYLGITLDCKLNFIKHAESIKQKITTVFGKLMRVTRCEWGLKGRSVSLLYDCVFKPILTYGAGAWYTRSQHSWVIRHLQSAQRFMLLSISRACRTTSTEALQVLCGKMPAELEIVQSGLVYCLKKGIETEYIGIRVNRPRQGQHPNEPIRRLKELVKARWQNKWENSDKGRVLYRFITNVGAIHKRTTPWFQPGLCGTFMLTGHGSFRGKLCDLGIEQVDRCACGQREDWEHVMYYCEMYQQPRMELKALLGDQLDLQTISTDKEHFKAFEKYANAIFTERNTYIDYEEMQ